MGSVISDCKCKRCGNEQATEDYYYKSGEMFTYCTRCGRATQFELRRTKEGQCIMSKDDKYTYTYRAQNPFAVVAVTERGKGISYNSVYLQKDLKPTLANARRFLRDNPGLVIVYWRWMPKRFYGYNLITGEITHDYDKVQEWLYARSESGSEELPGVCQEQASGVDA